MGGKPLAAEDAGTREMITEVLQDDEPKGDRGVRRTILDLIVWLEAEVAGARPMVDAAKDVCREWTGRDSEGARGCPPDRQLMERLREAVEASEKS